MKREDDCIILSERMYEDPILGYSVTGNEVSVKGERSVKFNDGSIIKQFIYDIVGYTPKNGLPFVARDCNIIFI